MQDLLAATGIEWIQASALEPEPCLRSGLAFCTYLIAIRLVLWFEMEVFVSRAEEHFAECVRI